MKDVNSYWIISNQGCLGWDDRYRGWVMGEHLEFKPSAITKERGLMSIFKCWQKEGMRRLCGEVTDRPEHRADNGNSWSGNRRRWDSERAQGSNNQQKRKDSVDNSADAFIKLLSSICLWLVNSYLHQFKKVCEACLSTFPSLPNPNWKDSDIYLQKKKCFLQCWEWEWRS